MRILDQEADKVIKNILLLLTPSEASELKDDLERILSENKEGEHSHICDINYEHEVTIAIYEDETINSFNNRIKKLLKKGN
ncbi:hypothetical protein [Defluviitalea phaphyphila]|uniref:hypothetical protein n=1 Tax=Defluviitalea phaphyphila TaxID=1473580 RepID=UPI00073083EC|nr:hypothetical protein [Defluviitalea phaphyphila]